METPEGPYRGPSMIRGIAVVLAACRRENHSISVGIRSSLGQPPSLGLDRRRRRWGERDQRPSSPKPTLCVPICFCRASVSVLVRFGTPQNDPFAFCFSCPSGPGCDAGQVLAGPSGSAAPPLAGRRGFADGLPSFPLRADGSGFPLAGSAALDHSQTSGRSGRQRLG